MPTELTQAQHQELQAQYDRLPDIGSSYEASGEHYILMAILNRYGYFVCGREDAIRLAERLLSQ